MIDGGQQGKGYGRRAMALLIDHVRARPHARELLLSHLDVAGHAGGFYQRPGFEYTGERRGPDLTMRLPLRPR